MKRKVFTIDDLLSIKQPTGLVPLHLSPDGRWLTLSARRFIVTARLTWLHRPMK